MCITITSSAETAILAEEKRTRKVSGYPWCSWQPLATKITQGALASAIGPLPRT